MSDSDISELSARGAEGPTAVGLHMGSAAHFPHHNAPIADPSDVEEIVISENVRPAAARDALAGTTGGARRDPADSQQTAAPSMSAYGLFPMQSKHGLPLGERELSSVLACHMTRRELHRLLARARADRNQDMFDCYFLHEVMVESDAEVTSTDSILCRACKAAIGAHGDSPLNSTGGGGGTGDQIGGFGAISRPPRRPAILGPNHEITSGFSRPPIVVAGMFLFLAAIAAALLVVPGLPTRLPLLPVAGSGLAALVAAFGCTMLSTRNTVEFDTDGRCVRVTSTRAPFVCGSGCGSVQSWPFGDIAGIFISPDGPKAPGGSSSRSHREGRLPQFASYSVSLELYRRHTSAGEDAADGTVVTVAPAKNPLVVDPAADVGVTPHPGDEHEDSQGPDAETAAWSATETVVLQRRVLSRDIAEVEADWQLFVATLTDSN